jgi:GAF domain-containing protein
VRPWEANGAVVSGHAHELARDLRNATDFSTLRKTFHRHLSGLWPGREFFFALFDSRRNRFQFLLEDGTLAPKAGSNFALDHFLTNPGRRQTYAERLHKDLDLLGVFRDRSASSELTIHSLAVPIHRNGFLHGAVGMFADAVFSWSEEDVDRLKEFGQSFLQASDALQRFSSPESVADTKTSPSGEEWKQMRERVRARQTMHQILLAQLPPGEVVVATCRELAALFPKCSLTIAVHFPENRIFAVHSPEADPVRMEADEAIEGYFLHHPDEDILAIEDYEIWTPPEPLHLKRRTRGGFRSGLFAAARMHGTLVGVLGLQSTKGVLWDAREIEMLHEAAPAFGLAFHQALIIDNLTFASHQAHQEIEEARAQARQWQARSEHLETAEQIVRTLHPGRTVRELASTLIDSLREHWPEAHPTLQRYHSEPNAFEVLSERRDATTELQPARYSVQNLFLNNLPVAHVLCDTPREIEYYRDLDPRLVEDCERQGFRSFCSAPIFIGDRLWGAVTLQSPVPIGPGTAETLTCVARAIAFPLAAAELCERVAAERSGQTKTPRPADS